jgi:hypothetical protein
MPSGHISSFRITLILAAIGFLLIVGWVYVARDLRGWEGFDPDNPTLIQATLPGRPNFTLEDCVPGTVHPYDMPGSDEYDGTASVTVLTCRSRSSALATVLGWLAH